MLTLAVVVTIVGIISTTVIANALLSSTQRVMGSGIITSVNVGAYQDAHATNLLSEVDWGIIDPGALVSETIYIKNEGNIPLALSLETENWNPVGSDTYLSLSWDYSGVPVPADQVIAVSLSIQVSENIQDISSFTFDILVTGTQIA